MNPLYGIFSVILALAVNVGASAAVAPDKAAPDAMVRDSVESVLHFAIGSSTVVNSFGGNAQALDSIIDGIERFSREGSRFSVDIIGLASPDGGFQRNMQLARQRADDSRRAIESRTTSDSILFTMRNGGINWLGLRSVVAASSLPSRDELLSLLNGIRPDGTLPEADIDRLMTMRGGEVWATLNRDYFPDLRVALVTVYSPPRMLTPSGLIAVYAQPEESSAVSEESSAVSGQSSATTDNSQLKTDNSLPTDSSNQLKTDNSLPTDNSKTDNSQPTYNLALKTNLIYDALLMPNVELEWLINDRWSVAVEADVAWWKNDSKHKYYQIMNFAAEGRYWFRSYKPWHGHYVGLSAGGGKFDLEGGRTGYKGEGFLTGLSYGFMFPVSRCLSFDAEVGLGYLYAQYKVYKPQDGHYLFQRESRTSYFGPVKVKFSIVWRFNDLNKKKARK